MYSSNQFSEKQTAKSLPLADLPSYLLLAGETLGPEFMIPPLFDDVDEEELVDAVPVFEELGFTRLELVVFCELELVDEGLTASLEDDMLPTP